MTYPTVSPLQLIVMERRSKARYPIVLKVHYRSLGRKLHLGEGQAVNLSSGGALVHSRHELAVGEVLEVCIEWPSLLDGRFLSSSSRLPESFVAALPVSLCAFAGINFGRWDVRFGQFRYRSSAPQEDTPRSNNSASGYLALHLLLRKRCETQVPFS